MSENRVNTRTRVDSAFKLGKQVELIRTKKNTLAAALTVVQTDWEQYGEVVKRDCGESVTSDWLVDKLNSGNGYPTASVQFQHNGNGLSIRFGSHVFQGPMDEIGDENKLIETLDDLIEQLQRTDVPAIFLKALA